MSNPLAWLWREFKEFLAQLQTCIHELVDPSSQRLPTPNSPPHHSLDAEANSQSQNAEATAPPSRIYFLGTDLPSIEPLERLLDEVWSYLKAQEHLIADDTQALKTLQQKIEANQQWVQFYESSDYPLQPPTPYELRFDRNRQHCYQQELAIYQQIYTLRQSKLESLTSNRFKVSIMLDNLRTELLKIDSYRTSIDRRFSIGAPDIVYSAADTQALINAVAQQFHTLKVNEGRMIADFNQQLTQLAESWQTADSA